MNVIFNLRLVAFFMAITVFFPLFSQDYTVYSLEGKVEKKTSKGWQILVRTDLLSSDDIIKINPASTLRILDKGNKQIYTFSQKGEAHLLSLLNKAKDENSSITGKMIAESKRKALTEKSHKSLGAAKRETDDENLEAIYACVVDRLNTGDDSGDLIVEKVVAEEGLVYLKFINKSDQAIFANILIHEESSPNWRPLFDPQEDMAGIYINAGDTIEFPHMILSDEGDSMVAVSFALDFDIYELANMLENRLDPLEIEVNDVNVYFVK